MKFSKEVSHIWVSHISEEEVPVHKVREIRGQGACLAHFQPQVNPNHHI